MQIIWTGESIEFQVLRGKKRVNKNNTISISRIQMLRKFAKLLIATKEANSFKFTMKYDGDPIKLCIFK